MIDLDVPGSPASVRAAAEWLSPTLRDAVDTWSDATAQIRTSSNHWQGESGDAYREVAGRAVTAGDDQRDVLLDAAEKLRAYAGQLERMIEDFDGYRIDAISAGLHVVGTVVHAPTTPVSPGPRPGSGAPSSDVTDWNSAQAAFEAQSDRVDLYDEIATDVGTAWGRLQSWIEANLVAFRDGTGSPTAASQLVAGLSETSGVVLDASLGLYSAQLTGSIQSLRDAAAQTRLQASAFQDALRSGHPGLRAAAEAADPAALRRAASGLEAAADTLGHSPLRRLPMLGTALGLGMAAHDIASGESASSVIVGEVGAAAGGALTGLAIAGGAALIGVTAPVSVVAIGVVVGSVAIGAGATWAYENLVPQDIRESIDAGLEDAWDATTDFAEDAWDTVSDGVSDAWNAVLG